MRITFSTLNSKYEIDTVTNQYRKNDGDWHGCKNGGVLSLRVDPSQTYQIPIEGDRYCITRDDDKNVLTTSVQSVTTSL